MLLASENNRVAHSCSQHTIPATRGNVSNLFQFIQIRGYWCSVLSKKHLLSTAVSHWNPWPTKVPRQGDFLFQIKNSKTISGTMEQQNSTHTILCIFKSPFFVLRRGFSMYNYIKYLFIQCHPGWHSIWVQKNLPISCGNPSRRMAHGKNFSPMTADLGLWKTNARQVQGT